MVGLVAHAPEALAEKAFFTTERALFAHFPALADAHAFAALGQFPTPVEALERLVPGADPRATTFVKRDDLSAVVYGGNKVRTLEVFFGQALRAGVRDVYSTGAFGSNHALATVLHAPRVGLVPGALLFPQPWSETAAANLRITAVRGQPFRALAHWSLLPLGMWRLARAQARAQRPSLIMPPGGATPLGALGYVSAALELAAQIERGELPAPAEVVVGVGSTCTSAGLLVGLALASRLGVGWRGGARARLVSVRVTPWPVTSAYRIVSLAQRAARLLGELTRDARFSFTRAELGAGLVLDGAQIGEGYGLPSRTGLDAIARLEPFASLCLDTTYASKAAAGLLVRIAQAPDVVRVFWSTKSSAPLPAVTEDELALTLPAVKSWLLRR
jgi:1-aminocyclopropane-1-carboxylate deaminase/D-cysteine desulfhydrase-like pyridoxal-dependent ACC family enzyme